MKTHQTPNILERIEEERKDFLKKEKEKRKIKVFPTTDMSYQEKQTTLVVILITSLPWGLILGPAVYYLFGFILWFISPYASSVLLDVLFNESGFNILAWVKLDIIAVTIITIMKYVEEQGKLNNG